MTDYNDKAPLVLHIKKDKNGGPELYERFVMLDRHLVNEVHRSVEKGAAAIDGIWLNNHGPKHISTVIRRIGELVSADRQFTVTPYEAYLLAVATHFHDIGNVFGRTGHEKRARSELFRLSPLLTGDDTIEKRKIADIAEAHGGKVDGSEDTIGSLPNDAPTRRLAAILRFADELADDYTRTWDIDERAMKESERIRKKSEIYHLYSQRLRSVKIDHDSRSVELIFDVLPSHLKKMYYKDGKQRYFLDEIFERTLKVHREQTYCSRFMMPNVVSDRISVKIDVCTPGYDDVLGRFVYTLEQKGYPSYIRDFGALVEEFGLRWQSSSSMSLD